MGSLQSSTTHTHLTAFINIEMSKCLLNSLVQRRINPVVTSEHYLAFIVEGQYKEPLQRIVKFVLIK